MRDDVSNQSSGANTCIVIWSIHLCLCVFLGFGTCSYVGNATTALPVCVMHHVPYCNAMYLHVHCRPSSGGFGVQGP